MDFVDFMQQFRRQRPSRSRRRQLPELRLARGPNHRAGHQRPRQHKAVRMAQTMIRALRATLHHKNALPPCSRLDLHATTRKILTTTCKTFANTCACVKVRIQAAAQNLGLLLHDLAEQHWTLTEVPG